MTIGTDTLFAATLERSQELLFEQYAIPGTPVKSEDLVLIDLYSNAQAECSLVVAGTETREKYSLATLAPIHFVKNYQPAGLAYPVSGEKETQIAAQIWKETNRTAIPIGGTHHEARFEFVAGPTLAKARPLPNPRQLIEKSIQAEVPVPEQDALLRYWGMLESSLEVIEHMHDIGLIHGDPHMNNFIWHGKEAYVVDFGMTEQHTKGTARFEAGRKFDLSEIVSEAALTSHFLPATPKGPLKTMVEEHNNRPARENQRRPSGLKQEWLSLLGRCNPSAGERRGVERAFRE